MILGYLYKEQTGPLVIKWPNKSIVLYYKMFAGAFYYKPFVSFSKSVL